MQPRFAGFFISMDGVYVARGQDARSDDFHGWRVMIYVPNVYPISKRFSAFVIEVCMPSMTIASPILNLKSVENVVMRLRPRLTAMRVVSVNAISSIDLPTA